MDLILHLDQDTLRKVREELLVDIELPIHASHSSLSPKNKHSNHSHTLKEKRLNYISQEQFIIAVLTVILTPTQLEIVQQNIFTKTPSPRPNDGNNDKDIVPKLKLFSTPDKSPKNTSPKGFRTTRIAIPHIMNDPTNDKHIQIQLKRNPTVDKIQLQLQQTVHSLKRIFDLVDVDHQGFIAWPDLTNYCIRAGNFAFRGSISQSHTSFRQMDGIAAHMVTIPVRKLYYISYMNLLYTTDSVQSIIRIFRVPLNTTISSVDGANVRIHGVYYPHKEFTNNVLQNKTENKPKYLSGSAIFQRAKQITKTDDLFTSVKKKTILGLAFVQKRKCMCLSTADRYLLTLSYRDTPIEIMRKEFNPNQFEITRYQFTENVQSGLLYSSSMDVLISWAGEDTQCRLNLWHVEELTLLDAIFVHSERVLDMCEVVTSVDRNFIVSSGEDRKVYVWSVRLPPSATENSSSTSRPLTREVPLSMQLRAERQTTNRHVLQGQVVKYELKGHQKSIRSLAYATQSCMVIGSGFDFEVYVWDPWSKLLMMKLVGHVATLFKVIVVFCPSERVVSVDEEGTIKIWNIGRDVVGYGELIQSFAINDDGQPAKVVDISPAFDGGRVFAVQTDRLHFFAMDDEYASEGSIVKGGLGFCLSSGALFTVSDDLLSFANIRTGKVLKRLFFADDHISNVIAKVSDIPQSQTELLPSAASPRSPRSPSSPNGRGLFGSSELPSFKDTKQSTQKLSRVNSALVSEALITNTDLCVKINSLDRITAATFDDTGKKLFLGTYQGRLLLYDSNTFGLLKDLTTYDEGYSEDAGAITSVCYSQRDGIVIAVYANGFLRAYNGFFHISPGSEVEEMHVKETRRRPPPSPILLRSTTYPLCSDHSINHLIFSEDTNTMVAANNFGMMWVFAYHTFVMHNVLCLPTYRQQIKDLKLTHITFLDRLPLILVTDSAGRVSMFQIYPQDPELLATWKPTESPMSEHFQSPNIKKVPLNYMKGQISRNISSTATVMETETSLVEVKSILVDRLSLPTEHDTKPDAPISIQRLVSQNSPRVTPTYASRHSRLHHIKGVDIFNHGFSGHTNASSNITAEKERPPSPPPPAALFKHHRKGSSSNIGLRRDNSIMIDASKIKHEELRQSHWYVFFITSHGRIIEQDITELLDRQGSLGLLPYYGRERGDMSVYTLCIRTSPIDGCRQLNILEDVEHMLKYPIGSEERAPNHIDFSDIMTMAHWRIDSARLATTPLYTSPISNITFIPTTSIREPYLIAVADARGEVLLWSWNGVKYLGSWEDLRTRDIRILSSEASVEESQASSQGMNHIQPIQGGGWKIPGGLLVQPSYLNPKAKPPSRPQSPTASVESRFGSDWAALLEVIHRNGKRQQSRTSPLPKWSLEKSFNITGESHGWVSPDGDALTGTYQSTEQSIHSLFAPRVSTDYKQWKEALTSTDSFSATESSTSRSKSEILSAAAEWEKKQEFMFQRILQESENRNKKDAPSTRKRGNSILPGIDFTNLTLANGSNRKSLRPSTAPMNRRTASPMNADMFYKRSEML